VNVVLYLLLLSLMIGGAGLAVFLWTLRSGQYDDMEGAANRILFDDAEAVAPAPPAQPPPRAPSVPP